MLLEVEGIIGMLLNDLKDFDRLSDNLEISVSKRGGHTRMLLLPQGRHHHLDAN